MSNRPDRREFTKVGIGSAATLGLTGNSKADERVRQNGSPNESIRIGMIGVGNRGSQLIGAFSNHADCKVVAAADVYKPYLDRAKKKLGPTLDIYGDYQQIIDRTDIDAVVVATPDHWHALQTVHAVAAGKDVYVEKPLSVTVVEGRKMIDAAKKHKRIVQVGLQRRSMDIYKQLDEYLRGGSLGPITVSRAYRLNNMYPDGIGKLQRSNPPADLNWDRWLGPRAKRAYQDNIAPYKFRWWINYSSQMGNWGVHYFDLIRWMLAERAPKSVVCVGGRYAVDDDRTIPDTAEAIFEMPGGSLLIFGQYEASSNPAIAWGEVEFRGTQGTVYAGANGYKVLTEPAGQFQEKKPRAEPINIEANEPNASATSVHARNFLDCVKSRNAPRCPAEEGHRSTIFAHLANISLATGDRLEWDSENERFKNNETANEFLHYEYRKGFEFPE